MSIGIRAIASFVPPGRESTEEAVFRNGGSKNEARLLDRVHGLKQIPRAAAEEKLEDLLALATQRLLEKVDEPTVDCIFYAHSILAQSPMGYQPLKRALEKNGLGDVPTLGISHLNCASAIGALSLVDAASRRYKNILMLIGDSTGFLPETRHISHSTIMGDAATAVLFDCEPDGLELLSQAIVRDTRFYPGFYQDKEGQKEFGKVYQTRLRESLDAALGKARVNLKDLRWIFPHNVNLTTWRRFCQQSGFPRNRVYLELLSDIGHCYCNDAFLNLERALEKQILQPGDLFAVVGVGIGSFFGTAIFRSGENI